MKSLASQYTLVWRCWRSLSAWIIFFSFFFVRPGLCLLRSQIHPDNPILAVCFKNENSHLAFSSLQLSELLLLGSLCCALWYWCLIFYSASLLRHDLCMSVQVYMRQASRAVAQRLSCLHIRSFCLLWVHYRRRVGCMLGLRTEQRIILSRKKWL